MKSGSLLSVPWRKAGFELSSAILGPFFAHPYFLMFFPFPPCRRQASFPKAPLSAIRAVIGTNAEIAENTDPSRTPPPQELSSKCLQLENVKKRQNVDAKNAEDADDADDWP